MRIGILTLNGYFNYGNRLQNYALQTLLHKLLPNSEIETIWNTADNYILNKHAKMYGFKNLRRYLFDRHSYRKIVDSNIYINKYIREYNIKKFSDRYLNIVYDHCTKTDLNDRYDFFIVGSDQVWNPHVIDSNNVFFGICEIT